MGHSSHHKHHGIHLLGKHSNKKAVTLLKGIGKGAKGIADEVYKFTPMAFLENNPIMGTGIVIAGAIVAIMVLRR
jgi:hypothetical protein